MQTATAVLSSHFAGITVASLTLREIEALQTHTRALGCKYATVMLKTLKGQEVIDQIEFERGGTARTAGQITAVGGGYFVGEAVEPGLVYEIFQNTVEA